MPPLAFFGIESSGLNLAVDLLILFVVVLYLALIYWTYADAKRRIEDPMLVACATAAAFFPFVGPIVYAVVRPPEYLEDVHERELEIRASETRLIQLEEMHCPHCEHRIEADFIRCPSCLRKLKERCGNCSRPLDQAWTICPYCEADVPGISQPRPRRRRTMATIEAERDVELEGSSPHSGEAEEPVGLEIETEADAPTTALAVPDAPEPEPDTEALRRSRNARARARSRSEGRSRPSS